MVPVKIRSIEGIPDRRLKGSSSGGVIGQAESRGRKRAFSLKNIQRKGVDGGDGGLLQFLGDGGEKAVLQAEDGARTFAKRALIPLGRSPRRPSR
ncbi:hypothetical protein MASR2M17_09330 [Aminivibrio sp.]